MPLRYEKHITRAMLKAEPDVLWVFGDNLARKGFGGQAREMRGEPNAVGISTKRAPSNDPDAFFNDGDLDAFREASVPVFERLRAHIEAGGTVVWPADGIGTGLARLSEKAPRISASLERARVKLDGMG